MAVAAPLVVVAADALLDAIVTVGSVLAGSLGIIALSEAIDKNFSKDKTSSTKPCEKDAKPEPQGNAEGEPAPPARVTPKSRKHILDGDGEFSGGHRGGTGKPGKSEFPESWSDDKIIGEIESVANDPAIPVKQQGDRIVKIGTREGIDIKTVTGSDGEIVTGYPVNVPRNP
jgi:hypothetical protein